MPISTSERISDRTADRIRADALALGFDVCRIAPAALAPRVGERLDAAIAQGHHATMDWLADTAARRRDPRAMWGEARSAVVLGTRYTPLSDPLETAGQRGHANISVYARSRDYHDVIKGRLKTLASKILSRAGEGDVPASVPAGVKVFVDTAPLMEKPLAQAAGLGWQGKHTNLVSRDHGSWLMLGTILTTLDLPPDAPETDHCGSCRMCQDACPTDAFPRPYQLDARRCISYLTIEHRGPIPRAFREPMGNRVFGCDDCLAVCPWNKFAARGEANRIAEPDDWRDPSLLEMLALDDATFRKRFAGSPVKRTGRDRFVRNCAVAAGNSGDVSLVPALQRLTRDDDAAVRGAAAWGLRRLAPHTDPEPFLARERDGNVRAEWS